MLMDIENTFADEQAVTATAQGTTPVDLTIDRAIGNGEPLFVQVFCNVTATSGGSATFTTSLVTGDALASGVIDSPTTKVTGETVALAALTAGALVDQFTIPANTTFDRYLNVLFTVGTADLTAGNFTAVVSPARQVGKRNAPAEI